MGVGKFYRFHLLDPSNRPVNVGILGTMGYFAYTRRDQPWDRRIVGGAVASTLALFGAEG